MFCPKCGKADQEKETYCRQCGMFLADFEKPEKRKTTPEEHLKANAVLNLLSAIVSFTLAVAFYTFYAGRENTPILMYITAGFLTAVFAWQIQTFWRTMLLKKHFKKRKNVDSDNTPDEDSALAFENFAAEKLLRQADHSNVIPASVTELTTKNLIAKNNRRSS